MLKNRFLLGSIFAVVFALLFLLGHQWLPKLYVNSKDLLNSLDLIEVVKIASTLLLAAAVFQITDSLQVITLGALRGLQDVKIPTLITFVAYWVIGFPISYLLGKPEQLGSLGIWIGLVAGLSSAAIMLFLRFRYLSLRLIESSEN